MKTLSSEMQRLCNVLQKHKKLIRYDGGFWHIEGCQLEPGYNGGRIEYYVPIHPELKYFAYKTIKALKRRELIKVTETDKYNRDISIELI